MTAHAPATTAGVPRRWWRQLGPGLITGAADDDPSGIATYSQAGAQFGFSLGWTLLLSYPLMVAMQLASARIGRVTGCGLATNLLQVWPGWLVLLLVALLTVANTINIGANLNAMGDAARLVFGGSRSGYIALFCALSLALQVFVPYHRYVNVLKWLTLSLLAYVAVLFSVQVDSAAALRGLLWPNLRWDPAYLTMIVAVLGTTISPYLFFWQADEEVEEIDRVPVAKPLNHAPHQARPHLARVRRDTLIGMGISNLVALSIVVATAATLHAAGQTNIETTSQAAEALRPAAGDAAFMLFAVGLIGTGLLSLPVLAGATAYAVAAVANVSARLCLEWRSARGFYGVIAASMLAGLLIGVLIDNPIDALVWSAVVNAVAAVPIMAAVLVIAVHPRLMGNYPLERRWRIVGWMAVATMTIAVVSLGIIKVIG